eukprot:gnl/Hemi2/25980_TR8723_c0_g1_i1.p1 gnl/Hemi2/25980_TR8723_c0_g1~~gnl/Hemi2/25980_TR8723_c0_g1_i1.p1  ORF type:complete len:298 (+),score=100.60 gnl/Hemi2/25980_TR8723_c0_g1_i1:95-988(+)
MHSVHKLCPRLVSELAKVRAKRAFSPHEWVEAKANMLNDYMRKCGLKSCVVSVSGGIDSAVTLALCMHARRKENSPIVRVVGIAQPIHSTASIQNRAYEAAQRCGAEVITIDQSALHTQLSSLVEAALKIEGGSFARGQLRSYMRTPVSYFAAQLLSQHGFPACVLGTGNYDEDGYLLYFCKAGDGVADVQLIADLHKSEVFAVGRVLNVPKSILTAPPSADLWEGQTDEGELGFTYDFVELYTEFRKRDEDERKAFLASLDDKARKEFLLLGSYADAIHRRNSHKLVYPLNLNCKL